MATAMRLCKKKGRENFLFFPIFENEISHNENSRYENSRNLGQM
jgi:hypothetical protein